MRMKHLALLLDLCRFFACFFYVLMGKKYHFFNEEHLMRQLQQIMCIHVLGWDRVLGGGWSANQIKLTQAI